MAQVFVEHVNEVWVRVKADPGIVMELREHFTFTVPGHQFMPSFQNKIWDGKIRLLNGMTGAIYNGLTSNIVAWCKSEGYSVELDENLDRTEEITEEMLDMFIRDLNPAFAVRDYQRKALMHGVKNDRAIFLSPTASGKSFIIYLLAQVYIAQELRTLLIVPTVPLTIQMEKDFKEYNHGVPVDTHKISAGKSKDSDAAVTITTWQSVFKMPAKWFNQFDVVIGDEAHNFKSKSLVKILENTPNIRYRFGFTGTLDGSKTNKLVLEGLFGEVLEVEQTDNLIKNKTLADFEIKAIVLKHNDLDCKIVATKHKTYAQEQEWITSEERRNKYVARLAQSVTGNTLVLFNYVEGHGHKLLPMIEAAGNKPVYYIHGGIKAEERERIREIVENSDGCVLLASFGSFSTGSNIKRLHNMVLASSTKSVVRTLQSIGRVLRRGGGKDKAVLYDIVDDLRWKSRENYAVAHFSERLDIYNNQKFKVKIYNVEL